MIRTSRLIKTALVSLGCLAFAAACGPARNHAAAGGGPDATAAAAIPAGRQSVWIELGTQSGPIPTGTRSEPAHLLIAGGQPILIDAGDGAAEQLAKAHVALTDVRTVFISHLHFDHTGGLFAIMGLRYQAGSPNTPPLTIYGPPGTKALAASLRAAIQPASALTPTPVPDYNVIELNDGSKVSLGGVTVTAAANSHYVLWNGAGPKPVSLSYRFDMPDRSIVYTGDTGPSANVERLAHGADLLVSEIMDADTALAAIKRNRPDIPAFAFPFVRRHFDKEHLSADQVGLLAERAGVHALVLTHFGGATGRQDQIDRLTRQIARRFHGPIRFANDLDRF